MPAAAKQCILPRSAPRRPPPPCNIPHAAGAPRRPKRSKSGEPAAETHDEQPSECLGAGSFEQNADQQRTRGIDRERTRRESQQRLPRHYPAGKQVTDDAAGSTAASYGQKFTNHKLNIRQILRICKFTEKMLTDCYFSCRFFEVFVVSGFKVGGFVRRPRRYTCRS